MSYGKIAALSVFLMPVVGFVFWFGLVCIGFGIHDLCYGRAQPGSRWSDEVFAAWVLLMLALIVGAVIGGACPLCYLRRRIVTSNRAVWKQGHEELAQAVKDISAFRECCKIRLPKVTTKLRARYGVPNRFVGHDAGREGWNDPHRRQHAQQIAPASILRVNFAS